MLSLSFKNLLLLLPLWTLATASAQAATPLPPAPVLNKISLIIRGRAPLRAESEAFSRAAAGDEAAFLKAYGERLDAYFRDPGFANQVEAYHQVWWHMPSGESTHLASYIVTQDRPYREIFVKDYLYLAGGNVLSNFNYVSVAPLTATPLPALGESYQVIRLSPDEPRFRSIFSNIDFLQRFPDTATNSNRKRANHIFRTFLCENLTNVVLPGAKIPVSGPHGSSPECLGCHTRLDPMARFFDQWPPYDQDQLMSHDGSRPAIGSLVVKGPDGSAQATTGTTESALGVFLSQSPQVQQCLVQKIWEFAAGPNTRLEDSAKAELVATLQRTGSFKSTLKQAFLHPYLWSTEAPSPLNFADVAPSLQGCATCHAKEQAPFFDAEHYPFSQNPDENRTLLRRIYGAATNVAGYVRMPPGTQPSLPSESLAKLRDWIGAGALDAHLQATINDADSKEILDE
jgi:hypothetical protein